MQPAGSIPDFLFLYKEKKKVASLKERIRPWPVGRFQLRVRPILQHLIWATYIKGRYSQYVWRITTLLSCSCCLFLSLFAIRIRIALDLLLFQWLLRITIRISLALVLDDNNEEFPWQFGTSNGDSHPMLMKATDAAECQLVEVLVRSVPFALSILNSGVFGTINVNTPSTQCNSSRN